MRKFFRFATMALVAIAITACDKDDKKTIAPDNGGDEDYKEITVSCSIDLMAGIETVGYSMGEMSMPGDKILEFFDMTAKEFYKAMGTYTGAAGATTQVDNTIQFGVCTGNGTLVAFQSLRCLAHVAVGTAEEVVGAHALVGRAVAVVVAAGKL